MRVNYYVHGTPLFFEVRSWLIHIQIQSGTQHVFTLVVVEMVRGIIKAENNENEFSIRIPMYNNGD